MLERLGAAHPGHRAPGERRRPGRPGRPATRGADVLRVGQPSRRLRPGAGRRVEHRAAFRGLRNARSGATSATAGESSAAGGSCPAATGRRPVARAGAARARGPARPRVQRPSDARRVISQPRPIRRTPGQQRVQLTETWGTPSGREHELVAGCARPAAIASPEIARGRRSQARRLPARDRRAPTLAALPGDAQRPHASRQAGTAIAALRAMSSPATAAPASPARDASGGPKLVVPTERGWR